jgi:hypothetical protein
MNLTPLPRKNKTADPLRAALSEAAKVWLSTRLPSSERATLLPAPWRTSKLRPRLHVLLPGGCDDTAHCDQIAEMEPSSVYIGRPSSAR